MARPLRFEAAGVVYHVMARGNERKAVFRDHADRQTYLSRLAHYREKFGFRLLAFCLMDNHVHLAVETGQQPLSRVMAGLQASYTQAFNRRHRRVGHLFQGRYKAFVVDRDMYLLALVRYIHDNPVAARMVERPGQYRWSSDRYYRRGKGPEWLDMDLVLSMLGRRRGEAVRRYRALMAREPEVAYEDATAVGQVVKGDEQFARRLLQETAVSEPTLRWLSEERVASEVAASLGIDLGELRSSGRRKDLSQARALVAWLGKRLGGISFDRMGRYLGRDGSTLVRDVGALERQLEASPGLKHRANSLSRVLRGK